MDWIGEEQEKPIERKEEEERRRRSQQEDEGENMSEYKEKQNGKRKRDGVCTPIQQTQNKEQDKKHPNETNPKQQHITTSKILGTAHYRKPRIGDLYQASLPTCTKGK